MPVWGVGAEELSGEKGDAAIEGGGRREMIGDAAGCRMREEEGEC